MPHRSFVIETSRLTAGIVTSERSGFRFHSAHPDMRPLEGTIHRTPEAAQRAAERLADAPQPRRRFRKGG